METKVETETDDSTTLRLKTGRVEDFFLQTSFDINVAVQTFVRHYEAYYGVSVCDCVVESEAVPEGTYFLSGILRLRFVYVNGRGQQLRSSAIIKIPELGAHRIQAKFLLTDKKEKYMYETVIPSMYGSWPHERVVPTFFGSTDSGILVLENLRECGYYQNANGSLLDLSTCNLVLRAIAQFHALSVNQVEKYRATLNSMTVVDRDNSVWSKKIYPALVTKLRAYVLPFSSRDIQTKFENYIAKVSSIFRLGQMSNEGAFNVILQGDMHQYNVLFKDDEKGTPERCKIIDFQYSRLGSPIMDIMLFLVTSTRCEVLQKNWDSLFRAYLDELRSVLREQEAGDRPSTIQYTLDDLVDDFEKYKLVFIYPLICYVPIFWAGQCGDVESIKNENGVDVVLKSKKYISFFGNWIKCLLPKF